MTERQQAWADAALAEAQRGNDVAAGFFALLALPNENERTHNCLAHCAGFRTPEGRRGFRCQAFGCGKIVKWVDPETTEEVIHV